MSEARVPGNERRRAGIADPDLWKWFKDGRLETIPASRDDRHRALAYIAERFERGREYAEAEVNVTIAPFHRDVALIRRYLVDEGLLTRAAGVYRRAASRASDAER